MATDEPNGPAPRRGPYLKRPRGERNPPGKFSYPVHAKNQSVEKQWEALCISHAGNARRCYDHLARTPYDPPPNPDRGHALRGSKRLGRRELLQYEVGGGARVWYRVDEERHIVIVQEVHVGHPKATE